VDLDGPAQKTPRRMNGDTREWWIVQSGSLKFTVDGREPLIATKGFMVQVPYRTLYQIETVGNEPALRFEVNVTRARKLYPMDETPVPLGGFDYVPTKVTGGRGILNGENRPVVDFNKVVAGQERGGPFVSDDRAFANIIIGQLSAPGADRQGALTTRKAPSSGSSCSAKSATKSKASPNSKRNRATSCTHRARRGTSRASAAARASVRAGSR